MRNPRDSQRELGEVRIEDIELDIKFRDDTRAFLTGPRGSRLRNRAFFWNICEDHALNRVRRHKGTNSPTGIDGLRDLLACSFLNCLGLVPTKERDATLRI